MSSLESWASWPADASGAKPVPVLSEKGESMRKRRESSDRW